jgi:3-dehydroquinate dehydratase/shikimate dehydrogenase
MICLSCTGSTIEENLRNIEQYRKYLEIVELRVDFLDAEESARLSGFPKLAGLPVILTYRKPEDGGVAAEIDEKRRLEILVRGLSGGYSYIDIEDDADSEYTLSLITEAEKAGTKIIRSFHDFEGVPDNLYTRMISASGDGRYIPKAAVMPEDSADFFKIINTSRMLTDSAEGQSAAGGGFILLGMGVYGFPTRVLARAMGSMLTFTSPAGSSAAPGHISPEELTAYGYNNISRRSRVFGIIGKPVMHSKSPRIHNGGYRKLGIDAVYLPFETSEPELFIEHAELLNLGGLSVTHPHKQRVIPLAGLVDQSVKAIGASNTLINRGEEGWEAYNTDYIGFLEPLKELQLEGKDALVIGAGGAARAVVYALLKRGMRVVILNRTAAKAEKLSADFGCFWAGLESYSATEKPYLVVQTTSVGMSPDIEGDPIPDFNFSGTEVVYDLIYTPEKTTFLQRADDAGCRIINGYKMLEAQAAEQFLLFTGCKANF